MGLPQGFPQDCVHVVQGIPLGNFKNHVEPQVTAAPKELVKSPIQMGPSMGPTQGFPPDLIDILLENSHGSLVEIIPNQQQEEENAPKTNKANIILYETIDQTPIGTNDSQMAKILAQTSKGSFVEFLANQEEENTGKLKIQKELII